MEKIWPGQLVEVTAEFRVGATLTDPTTVTFIVDPPTEPPTTYVYGTDPEVTKLSTGRYQVKFVVPVGGTWRVRGEGTDACQTAKEISISVENTTIRP